MSDEPVCGNCGETFEDHDEIRCDYCCQLFRSCDLADDTNECTDHDEEKVFRSETDEDRAALRASAMEGGL